MHQHIKLGWVRCVPVFLLAPTSSMKLYVASRGSCGLRGFGTNTHHSSAYKSSPIVGNLGLLEQEEEKYRLAIDINSNYALAFMWLGNNLLLQGQLNDGIDIFEEALALDPMNPAVIINLARSAMYMGNIDQAVLYLQAAELVMPDSALVHEQRAWMLREFGRLSL